MDSQKTSLDCEVEGKKFSFISDSDSSLYLCMQALSGMYKYCYNKTEEAQKSLEQVPEVAECHLPQE